MQLAAGCPPPCHYPDPHWHPVSPQTAACSRSPLGNVFPVVWADDSKSMYYRAPVAAWWAEGTGGEQVERGTLRLPFVVNALPQIVQAKGFSPV